MPALVERPELIESVLTSLGISPQQITARSLVVCPEAQELVVAEIADDGREHMLIPTAAKGWRQMSAAALSDGVTVKIASAFRSIDRQAEIVRAKLARGLSLDAILCVSAPPGYSEHHSGRAVDVTTGGVAPFECEFGNTVAFQWLSKNASQFGFVLSFPENNPYGYAYEPWHWCFQSAAV
ncbi:MAG TPA: M15 family metallopeptidase [Burkholderiales bacterium]|nr:M15 family metallopeptidase [Burkholderiales bacterium]